MSDPDAPGPVLAILGPTAVGKTAVAEEVALRRGGEIVSADSMQVYRGMDIGTSKPAASERRVPYHCIDLVEPGTPYSAALFQQDARSAIGDILARERLPIVTGGTGLYVRAALDDMEFPRGVIASPGRRRLEALAEELGPEGLHARLAEIDPEAAALLHRNDTRRVVRALEMSEVDGVSYADQRAGFSRRRSVYRTTFVALTMERVALYRRIDQRVDAMLAAGLVDEVQGLLAAGYRAALTAAQAIGYKELVPVIEAEAPLPDAVSAIQQASRRYAKRQMTWLRADPRVSWVDVTDLSLSEAVERVLSLVES
jgi:tRNA dimethylallyltransferase